MVRKHFGKSFLFGVSAFWILALAFAFATSSDAFADDVKELAKQAGQELRQSQRAMFGGKLDESSSHLEKAGELIDRIRSMDPGYNRLKSLDSKYAKQKKDLERRMPKAAKPPAPAKAADSAPSVGETGELPRSVTRRLKEIDKTVARLDDLFGKFQEKPTDSLANELGRYTEAAENQMEQLMDYYSDKIPENHPEVEDRRGRIAASRERHDRVVGDYSETKRKAAADKDAGKREAMHYKEALDGLYQKYRGDFEGVYGRTLVYDFKPETAREQLEKVRHLEETVLPEAQPLLAEIAEQYGTTPMEVNNSLHELGVPIGEQFGSEFEELYSGVENVVKSKKATAEFIARQAKDRLANVENLMSDIRVKRMEEVREMLQIAQKFDPNNAEVNAMLAELDRGIVEMAEKIEKQIDEKAWAGHVGDFAGPGDVEDLAAEAVEYFQNHPQWGKVPGKGVKVLAVAVRGQWNVAETDIFGQIVRWRLPIHIAVTDGELKPKNIARVYELSVLARQGAPGRAEKAPPYDGYWVGNNWMMRIDNVK